MSFTFMSLVETLFVSRGKTRTDNPGGFVIGQSPYHNDKPSADQTDCDKTFLSFGMLFVKDFKIIASG